MWHLNLSSATFKVQCYCLAVLYPSEIHNIISFFTIKLAFINILPCTSSLSR